MGPPFENGGGYGSMVVFADSVAASMGPPFENGGGSGQAVVADGLLRASMGPPFENGGGLYVPRLHKLFLTSLQWGRRSKTAEGQI